MNYAHFSTTLLCLFLINSFFFVPEGTTDSTNSEEDSVPPPLPVKLREADYCNLPEGSPSAPSTLAPPRTPVHNKVISVIILFVLGLLYKTNFICYIRLI